MAEKQLNPQRLGLLTHKAVIRVADAEVGTTLEQIKDPKWWAHVAVDLHPWEEIWVREESGAMYWKVLVLSTTRTTADVYVLAEHDLESKVGAPYERTSATACAVEWGGPYHKWRIRRGEEVLESGFQSRAQAHRALDGYSQALEH